jgi:flagellar hook-associated protein 1 FlgK
MAGLTSLLNVARDALTAQSYGLGVTGSNISNASTPGYVRRVALLQTQDIGSQASGSVLATGLQRVTDDFIERREFAATGQSSAATTRDQTLASVEALFNDTGGTGLGSSLSNLFSSFSSLANNPTDTTTRSNVLAAADAFTQRVNSTGAAIAQAQNDLKTQAQQTIDQVNQRAQEIAKLDMQIAQATMQGNDAADLKDQRTQKLLNISGLINTTTFTDAQGNQVVQVAGSTIVDGSHAGALSLDLHADGSLKLNAVQSGGGTTEITQYLTGGTLGGIKEARDTDIFDVSKKLDQFVFDTATAINTQHAAGVGADGGTGRALFDVGGAPPGSALNLKVSADVFNQPDKIAAAANVFSVPGGSDNAVAMAKLADVFSNASGTRTAAQAYGDLVGSVGGTRANSQRDVETQTAILNQVQAMHQSQSGVSLDEEMVALTKYQNAYQAASKVLNVADTLLGDLMNSVGR